MVGATSERPERAAPVSLLYVGLPAYVLVVVFTMRDVFHERSLPVAVVAIVAAILFSILFFWMAFSYHAPDAPRGLLLPVSVMLVLATVIALTGVNTSVFAAAVAAMAGDGLPLRQSVPVIAASTVLVALVLAGHANGPAEILGQGIVVPVVGLMTYGVRRMTESNRELLAAREEVARLAVLDERVRFARDLHDLLGHSLTVIRAKSELASRLAESDIERAADEMRAVEAVAREALVEVRETVTGYRRPTVATELRNARAALAAADIKARVATDVVDLPSDVDEALGWVLREMVTNVVRHSGASTCDIRIAANGSGVSLVVEDDGRGAQSEPGSGLTGARERLALIGGTLALDGDGEHGFRAVAKVPASP